MGPHPYKNLHQCHCQMASRSVQRL